MEVGHFKPIIKCCLADGLIQPLFLFCLLELPFFNGIFIFSIGRSISSNYIYETGNRNILISVFKCSRNLIFIDQKFCGCCLLKYGLSEKLY